MKSKEKVERTLSCFLRRLRHGRTGGTEGLPLSDVAANERGDGGVGGGHACSHLLSHTCQRVEKERKAVSARKPRTSQQGTTSGHVS